MRCSPGGPRPSRSSRQSRMRASAFDAPESGRMTTADIDSGRIIVRPSFADLFVCRQIPGSRWDAARKAWSLPPRLRPPRSSAKSSAASRSPTASSSSSPRASQSSSTGADHCSPGGRGCPRQRVRSFLPCRCVARARWAAAPRSAGTGNRVELPAGLRTKPWRHQRIAYKFCLDHFAQDCTESCWPWAWAPARVWWLACCCWVSPPSAC